MGYNLKDKVVAKNDDADDTTFDAHVIGDLQAPGYLVFRDYNLESHYFTATAGACIFIPRPAGLSGCATTSTISCSFARASRVGTANSGVPRKTIRNRASS